MIIITSQLRQLLEKYAVMEGSQYGFRTHRGVQIVVQRAHWVKQQAMKESGTLIRIDLDLKNSFNSAGHSCLWAILRGLGVPDVDFYSKSCMKITVGTGCSAPIQLDTGMVQGSVLSPLLCDLFLNALLRLLNATGITNGIKRTPQWNHAEFADDLCIYVCTVRDANKLLDVIHEFEFCSGLWSPDPNSEIFGYWSHVRYGNGKKAGRGKSRRGKDEKRCRPRHLKPSNPGSRSHG